MIAQQSLYHIIELCHSCVIVVLWLCHCWYLDKYVRKRCQ